MRRVHRSKCGVALGLVVAAAAPGCHKSAAVTTRDVVAYVPAACAVDGGGYAEYFAYGDFEPPGPPATGHFLSAVGTALPEVYDASQALVMTASESDRAWEGVGPVPPSGDVDVLLLPTLDSCPLTVPVGARTGSTMAPIGDERVMIAGGTATAGQPVPSTYVARLDTGEVDPVSPDLLTPRTGATVTAFGDGALVAGGTGLDGSVLGTAEVFSTASGGFDRQATIPLSEPRTQHGAVVLASGLTLLVGGRGGPDGTTVLASMETIDPVTHIANADGLPTLSFPRYGATVLRLASGEVLVAGGLDAGGNPVPDIEWFDADASPEVHPPQTPPLNQGPGSAFIALEAGGALAVLTQPAGSPAPIPNVYVIDPTGALDDGTSIPGTLTDPVLFGGAQGAPMLWTGDRWLQWQPYAGAFAPAAVLDDVPADVGDATCSPDPGLAMWLDPAQLQLTLLRFDTRNAYSTLPGPLLVTDTGETAPDRLGAFPFDIDQGGLTLQSGSPGEAVFVTDRTYADVEMQLTAPTGATALLVLRDDQGHELDVPGDACNGSWPATSASTTLTVERSGASVAWSVDGGPTTSCTVPFTTTARVSVGVRAGATTAGVVSDFVVTRLGMP